MERIKEGKCDPMGSTIFGMSEKGVRELIVVGHTIDVRPTTTTVPITCLNCFPDMNGNNAVFN